MCSLNELKPPETALIDDILVTNSLRRRLLDLGFAKGTSVTCVLESPQKDPKAFYVRGSLIAVRQSEAEKIKISRVGRRNE